MIHPVILCGGSGTRLWPLSRKTYPKQFADLANGQSLFQATAQRLNSKGFVPPTIITNADFRFIVTEQLSATGINPGAILIEPEARNTAPAVLASALYFAKTDPDALMLVTPSDHIMQNTKAFQHAITAAKKQAKAGEIIAFGITPERPETGYGYLELTNKAHTNQTVKLKRFIEKPDQITAQKLMTKDTTLWNAGVYLFSASTIITAFQTHAPDMLAHVHRSVDDAKTDLGFLRLDPKSWAQTDSISIDYAIMEHVKNLSVVPLKSGWSDIGDWQAVRRQNKPDKDGVITVGQTTAIDCVNSHLRTEDDTLELVCIGLDDITVVAMPDAVLVAHNGRAQDVKQAVDALRKKDASQAESFSRDFRPWGWFDKLATGDQFQVKRITINPGAALSLQSHEHRAEHWVVVKGNPQVTLNNTRKKLSKNQSIYIPAGAKHRLENPGNAPVIIIEVQTGSYLGEDDITRYEDIYART